MNFLTGDDIFTHQIPLAMDDARPWLRSQYPTLSPDNTKMASLLCALDYSINGITNKSILDTKIAAWVERVRLETGFPEAVPVQKMGEGMHKTIAESRLL